jgi:DnaJ-domain-containing protein 1
MSQIFNRFVNFVKSEINSQNSNYHQNDDLQAIIEELNKTKQKTEHQSNYSENQQNKQQKSSTNNEYKNNKQEPVNSSKFDLTSAFAILEIPENTTPEQIKSAYKQIVIQYHPDKVQNLGKDIRLLAEKKTIEINLAYEFIRKSKQF